jgi:hypothetical protein
MAVMIKRNELISIKVPECYNVGNGFCKFCDHTVKT